jgi:hypothetical protein
MAEKHQNQAIATDHAEEEHRGVEDARAILRSLNKFIHGKKIYAKSNPTLVKFAKEFDTAFQRFFQLEDELVITIDKYEITWREQVVYQSDKREDSIAFLLYKDGIGEVNIKSSVTFSELERFADLIKDEIHNFRPEEDIVTKFWKADFENISYRVLDEYLVGQFGEGHPDEAQETPLESEDHPDLPSFKDKGRVIVGQTDGLESITMYLNRLVDQSCSGSSSEEREEHFQAIADSLFKVSSEELRLCQEELSQEREQDVLVQFQNVIVDFALLSDNPSVVRDTTNVIESIVDFLVVEEDPAPLGATLDVIREFLRGQSTTEQVGSFFAGLEERLTNTEFLCKLGGTMGETRSAEEVFAYYTKVGKRAAPTICALLEDLDSARLHRMACDTLLEIAGDDIVSITDKLSIDVPKVAHDVVYLIEKTGTDDLPNLVEELLYYPDNGVREAIITYLAKADSEDAATLLVKLIDDTDKHIRMKTLAAVEDIKSPIIMNKLVAVAFDKDFGRKEFDEQELIFKAVGKQAGESVLPELSRMVEKKVLLGFAKGQMKQNKLLVIRALENIRTAEAIDMLEGLARDQNDLVKSRARRALNMLHDGRA